MKRKKNERILQELYQSASFLFRAVCFWQTGRYAGAEQELRKLLRGREREILDPFRHLKQGGAVKLEKMSGALFLWAGQ